MPTTKYEILPCWFVWPTISQKMLVGWHTACIWAPFFVHRKVPRSESIDFSHDGSFSTSHLGILLSLCTSLRSSVSQFIVYVSKSNEKLHSNRSNQGNLWRSHQGQQLTKFLWYCCQQRANQQCNIPILNKKISILDGLAGRRIGVILALRLMLLPV